MSRTSIQHRLISRNGVKGALPEVNLPYLYFGVWRATFTCHVKDMYLFSIATPTLELRSSGTLFQTANVYNRRTPCEVCTISVVHLSQCSTYFDLLNCPQVTSS